MTLYFDKEYMDRMWNSCKDVTFPQTNGKVIEGLMCDGKTGDKCTAEVWLNFQGLNVLLLPLYISKSCEILHDDKIIYGFIISYGYNNRKSFC